MSTAPVNPVAGRRWFWLDAEQMQQASERARRLVAGPRPAPADYEQRTSSKYPRWFTALTVLLVLLVVCSAWLLSSIRMYHITHTLFADNIQHPPTAQAAAWAMLALAEPAVLIGMLSMHTLASRAWHRALLAACIVLVLALALAANLEVAQPWLHASAFAWIEAIAPPLLVPAMGMLLEQHVLASMHARTASARAYEQAVQDWHARLQTAQQDDAWMQHYANAVRDALAQRNARGAARATRDSLHVQDWHACIAYQMHLHHATQQELQAAMQRAMHAPAPVHDAPARHDVQTVHAGRNGANGANGVHERISSNPNIRRDADGSWRVKHPTTQDWVQKRYASRLSAERAFAAYCKHANEEAA